MIVLFTEGLCSAILATLILNELKSHHTTRAALLFERAANTLLGTFVGHCDWNAMRECGSPALHYSVNGPLD